MPYVCLAQSGPASVRPLGLLHPHRSAYPWPCPHGPHPPPPDIPLHPGHDTSLAATPAYSGPRPTDYVATPIKFCCIRTELLDECLYLCTNLASSVLLGRSGEIWLLSAVLTMFNYFGPFCPLLVILGRFSALTREFGPFLVIFKWLWAVFCWFAACW